MRFGEFVSRMENHTAQSDGVLGEAMQGIAQFSEIHERLQTFMTNIDQKEQEVKNGLDNWLATKMGIEGLGENIPQGEGPLSSLFHLGMVGRRGSERRGEGSLVDGESMADDAENPMRTYIETVVGEYFAQAMAPGEDGETANPLQPFIAVAKQEISSAVQASLHGNEDEGIGGALPAIQEKKTEAVGQISLTGQRQVNLLELELGRAILRLEARARRIFGGRLPEEVIDIFGDDPNQHGDEMR